jgi:hypothetical protein
VSLPLLLAEWVGALLLKFEMNSLTYALAECHVALGAAVYQQSIHVFV